MIGIQRSSRAAFLLFALCACRSTDAALLDADGNTVAAREPATLRIAVAPVEVYNHTSSPSNQSF